MKVLVACEESQAVTIELRKLGHEAYSCDIIECSGGHPEWHIQWDALALINGNCSFMTGDGELHHIGGKWDMIIAFPPCTHLSSSGQWAYSNGFKDVQLREDAADFFMAFANADCPRIAIENPVGIMSSRWRKPNQIIHPWQFGHNAEKQTCLWLKGLPNLVPMVTEKPELEYFDWVDSRTGKKKRQEETDAAMDVRYSLHLRSSKEGCDCKQDLPRICPCFCRTVGRESKYRGGSS